jgi:hypothetical protein
MRVEFRPKYKTFRSHKNTVTCMSDYRRSLDWQLDLLNTYRS